MSERDPFKLRLRRRDVMFGCFVGQPSPAIAEMVGYAGFDYVIVDLEHGPTGLETLENMLRAAQAAGAASLVRLPSPAQADILRVLDAGADGILVPHVESAADEVRDESKQQVSEAHGLSDDQSFVRPFVSATVGVKAAHRKDRQANCR